MNWATFCLGPFALLVFAVFATAIKWRPMTKRQREWILRRDGYQCQKARFVNGRWIKCPRKSSLHVHHIFPKGALATWSPHSDPHTPDNLITLCGDAWIDSHHVSEVGIHPDLAFAKKDYTKHGDKEAYTRVFAERKLKLARGKAYWQTNWDLVLQRTAVENTRRYAEEHPDDPFPVTQK